MKQLVLSLLAAVSLSAGVVPEQYIVQLDGEPAATRLVRQGRRIHGNLAVLQAHRQQVRREQEAAQSAVAQQGTILGSVDTVANALLVRIPDEKAAGLLKIPGVKTVHPARQFRLLLDHAIALHKVPDAWSQIGGPDNAGLGMKIGIIDSGIDFTHPGFQDPALAVPSGFPKADSDADLALTNNKVIVARSYLKYLSRKDTDMTAQDHIGHGTALAMVSAGRQVTGALATIQGVAPRAQLGNYRIFGSPAVDGTTSETAILKAIDDAVADGMDVINCSFGSDFAMRLEDDDEVAALTRATEAGVIVVVSAGNSGPDYATVGSPATTPSAIAVGASANDRVFAANVAVPGQNSLLAIPGDHSANLAEITAPLADVAGVDGSGLACGALPSGSLSGKVALILRGTCYFEDKLKNAEAAGAVAGVIYTDQDRPDPSSLAAGASNLPAQMISYSSGVTLKQLLVDQPSAVVTLTFTLGPMWADPNRLAGFTSKGPNVDGSIKPDLVATGTNVYMATQHLDDKGDMYDTSGFTIADGTSFSSPLVAGAAALVKAARPGLTVNQYRSLLINSTAPLLVDGVATRIQQSGAGVLDVNAALRATAAVYPTALSLGVGNGSPRSHQSITVTNIGAAPEIYSLTVTSRDGGPAPVLNAVSFPLDPGQSQQVKVNFTADGLLPGAYEGFVHIQGVNSGVDSRVPYWYSVTSGTAATVSILDLTATGKANATLTQAITFHVTDASGNVLRNINPVVTVVSGGGSVRAIGSLDSYYPGVYSVNVRLGSPAGANVFRVRLGDAVKDVTITAN